MQKTELLTGCYEANKILDYKTKTSLIRFQFCIYKCDTTIYAGNKYTNNFLKEIFGHSQNKVIPKNSKEKSSSIMKITTQDAVWVECNIATQFTSLRRKKLMLDEKLLSDRGI